MAKKTYDRMSTEFGEHTGFVHKLAVRYYARVRATKLSLDYEDVFGELSLAFVKARNGFDPSKGYVFTTYFGMCAQNHINNWLGKLCEEQYGEPLPDDNTVSGLRQNSRGLGVVYAGSMDIADDGEFLDTLPSDDPSPLDRAIAKEALEKIINDPSLLPETRAYIVSIAMPGSVSDAVMRRVESRWPDVRAQVTKRWGVKYLTL
jgi:hypothetical protein